MELLTEENFRLLSTENDVSVWSEGDIEVYTMLHVHVSLCGTIECTDIVSTWILKRLDLAVSEIH